MTKLTLLLAIEEYDSILKKITEKIQRHDCRVITQGMGRYLVVENSESYE